MARAKSSVAKGNALERFIADRLRAQGYDVHQTPRRRFQANDIFGCFDLIATNEEMMRYIQSSTTQRRGAVLREMQKIRMPTKKTKGRVRKEYWVHKPKKGYIQVYDENGKKLYVEPAIEGICLS